MKFHSLLFCTAALALCVTGAEARERRANRHAAAPAAETNYYGPTTNYYGPVTINNGAAIPAYGDAPYQTAPAYSSEYYGQSYNPSYYGQSYGGADSYGYGNYGYGPAPQAWYPQPYAYQAPQLPPAEYFQSQRMDPWNGYNAGGNNGY